MKAWLGLQMVSIGSLLAAAAAGSSSLCVGADKLQSREKNLQNRFTGPPCASSAEDGTTCADAARQMSGEQNQRSVSPWRYRCDRNDSRIPHEISMAECLCSGCIVNQREEFTYNSVPVFAQRMVLMKSRCPDNPNKYVVY